VDPKVAAELERQARRRMLGNMQFIGQLYKNALLTERIMHNCVHQLLQVGGISDNNGTHSLSLWMNL
jgi:translation initiation factor 4G